MNGYVRHNMRYRGPVESIKADWSARQLQYHLEQLMKTFASVTDAIGEYGDNVREGKGLSSIEAPLPKRREMIARQIDQIERGVIDGK
jgi:hypothetical protein